MIGLDYFSKIGGAFRSLGRSHKGVALEPTLSLLIQAAEHGDRAAADALFSALYAELHRVAKRELARQGMPLSLGATTLLHQAYIEIAAREVNRVTIILF